MAVCFVRKRNSDSRVVNERLLSTTRFWSDHSKRHHTQTAIYLFCTAPIICVSTGFLIISKQVLRPSFFGAEHGTTVDENGRCGKTAENAQVDDFHAYTNPIKRAFRPTSADRLRCPTGTVQTDEFFRTLPRMFQAENRIAVTGVTTRYYDFSFVLSQSSTFSRMQTIMLANTTRQIKCPRSSTKLGTAKKRVHSKSNVVQRNRFRAHS